MTFALGRWHFSFQGLTWQVGVVVLVKEKESGGSRLGRVECSVKAGTGLPSKEGEEKPKGKHWRSIGSLFGFPLLSSGEGGDDCHFWLFLFPLVAWRVLHGTSITPVPLKMASAFLLAGYMWVVLRVFDLLRLRRHSLGVQAEPH